MTKIIHLGIGPLGQQIVRYAVERGNIKIVGAVDPDPAKAGRNLGEVCAIAPLGVTIAPDLKSALRGRKATVALLTTVSDMGRIAPQIEQLAKAGLNIVSTCEELSFPWKTAPRIARRIDRVCRKHNVACLGTGVNPGFLMDFLPSALTGVCRNVKKVKVSRIQDASTRRIPFQKKIGAGLTRAEFARKKAEGTLRHVGLTESMHMIAHALGWDVDKTTEGLKPVLALEVMRTPYATITPGMARGVEQIGRAYIGKRKVITLHFRAAVGEPESYDRVEIDGDPPISSTVKGGVHGDVATCAIVLNAVRSIQAAAPGLRTMLDVPTVTRGG